MITNQYNLPAPLVRALSPDRKPPVLGRLSVTSLIDAPLPRILAMQHFSELEEDASEGLWALLGKMGHAVLAGNDKVAEVKIEIPFGGAVLVGVVDYNEESKLIDWKFTSVWAAVFIKDKTEWEEQLQIYRYLVQSLGKPVSGLENYLILRDWKKQEWFKSKDTYPPIPFKKVVYTPWSDEKIEAFLSERVDIHLRAESAFLDPLEQELGKEFWCTPKQRWAKPDRYAAKNVGKDRAVRVFDTEEECAKFCHGTKMYLEHRPGEDSRCEMYCAVEQWCPYRHQKLMLHEYATRNRLVSEPT